MDKVIDKVIKLYKVVNGKEESFPTEDNPMVTSDFVYNAKRMGAAPTITCTVRHPQSLNTEWSENVFVNFNGSKFYLRKTPSSTYDNTDVRYKYELEFISEHVLLDNVYFFDVSPDSAYRGVSNTTTCTFSGNIQMFVKKLNDSLQYSKLQIVNTDGTIEGYQVFLPSDIDSEYKHLSFTDQFFSNALQEIYNTFKLPYYFKGKNIYVGHADEDTSLDVTLRYGQDEGLLSITKQNANHKLINRITGVGSTDNIPYYYPNETPLGSIALETLPTNTYFEARDLVIADTELLAQRIELNNPVKYFKYEVNKFDSILMRSIWENGDLHPASLGVYTGWDSLFPKTEEVTAAGSKHTYNYQLSFIGETTHAGGGLFRLAWQLPSHLDINDFIRLHGDIEYGVFENLKCYEFRDDKRVELEIKQVGQYPNIILEVHFQGYEGTISTFEGHVFDIYIEFTHWTHNVGSNAVYHGFSTTGFSSLSLNPGMDTTYTWKSSKFASPNLSDFGIIATRYPVNTDIIVGEGFTIQQTSYVIPQSNLMPAIYRDTAFVERFYNAANKTYTDTSGNYYQFEHPYIEGQPKEHIQNFEEIKPTIVGMVNAEGQPYNQFLEIAYDEGDNDEIDEKTETLLHPYFYVKLPKYNGTGAFNLFDHASESGAMQISMTSGSLSACTFDIAVSDTTQKNTVQIDSNGNLKRDEWGNVVRGTAQPEQNDTINNEVWIALHKDVTTFSSPVPNTVVINQPAVGDTFVILNIALPQGYIEAAEKRLEQELIRYMSENNSEKFNFSIKFSRIYLEEHPDVQAKLTENSSIIIEYQGKEYPLYVSSYTYKMTSNALLPEISVELADTLTIQKNAVEHMVGQAKTDILNTIASTNFVRQGVPYFLRKDVDDSAQGRLRFLNGFDSLSDAKFGNFRENTSGASVYKDESGNWHIETDFVRVRKKLSVKSIEIEEAHHIGGQQLLTAASAYISFVVDKGSYFRCFFLKEDSSGRHTYNQWKVGDQAYCRCFNLISQTLTEEQHVEDKYYWRKVVATSLTTTEEAISFTINGETLLTANYHFIDLSDIEGEYDTLSDIPAADDCVVQLGYQGEEEKNKSRQNAIILAGSGEGSPYIQQFVGINTFSLDGCLETQIKPNENILSGNTKFKTYEAKTEEEEDKFKTLDEFNKEFEGLESGVANLIKNSGFVGDYNTANLQEATSLREAFETFSPTLEHWEYTNAIAQDSSYSQSGKEVFVPANESLSQNIVDYIRANETYTLSFYAQGDPIRVTLGGTTQEATLATPTEEDDETTENENEAQEVQDGDSVTWQRYIIHIITRSADNKLSLQAVSDTCLCDLMLTKGTLTAAWTLSPLDNITAVANFEKTEYLRSLLKINTEIDGGEIVTGIINAGLIEMGNVSDEGQLTEKTSGISGIYNNNNSVAFWAGNDYEAAVATVMAYDSDPKYQPTEAELANMAKAVITHGGRAIMQDIILRGYVYAKGGEFNGTVKATDGVFNGTVVSKLVYGPTKVIEEDEYTINPSVEAFGYYVYYPRPVGSVDPVVILPSAQQYEGMEIAFYLLQPQTRAGGHWVTAKTTNGEQVVYTPNTYPLRIDEMLAYQFVHTSGQTVWGNTVVMCKDGEYRFKAIQGTWYAIAGLYIET